MKAPEITLRPGQNASEPLMQPVEGRCIFRAGRQLAWPQAGRAFGKRAGNALCNLIGAAAGAGRESSSRRAGCAPAIATPSLALMKEQAGLAANMAWKKVRV
mgnify:CR=1 FL=1